MSGVWVSLTIRVLKMILYNGMVIEKIVVKSYDRILYWHAKVTSVDKVHAEGVRVGCAWQVMGVQSCWYEITTRQLVDGWPRRNTMHQLE